MKKTCLFKYLINIVLVFLVAFSFSKTTYGSDQRTDRIDEVISGGYNNPVNTFANQYQQDIIPSITDKDLNIFNDYVCSNSYQDPFKKMRGIKVKNIIGADGYRKSEAKEFSSMGSLWMYYFDSEDDEVKKYFMGTAFRAFDPQQVVMSVHQLTMGHKCKVNNARFAFVELDPENGSIIEPKGYPNGIDAYWLDIKKNGKDTSAGYQKVQKILDQHCRMKEVDKTVIDPITKKEKTISEIKRVIPAKADKVAIKLWADYENDPGFNDKSFEQVISVEKDLLSGKSFQVSVLGPPEIDSYKELSEPRTLLPNDSKKIVKGDLANYVSSSGKAYFDTGFNYFAHTASSGQGFSGSRIKLTKNGSSVIGVHKGGVGGKNINSFSLFTPAEVKQLENDAKILRLSREAIKLAVNKIKLQGS